MKGVYLDDVDEEIVLISGEEYNYSIPYTRAYQPYVWYRRPNPFRDENKVTYTLPTEVLT